MAPTSTCGTWYESFLPPTVLYGQVPLYFVVARRVQGKPGYFLTSTLYPASLNRYHMYQTIHNYENLLLNLCRGLSRGVIGESLDLSEQLVPDSDQIQ